MYPASIDYLLLWPYSFSAKFGCIKEVEKVANKNF